MEMVALLDEGYAWVVDRVGKVQPQQLDASTPCAAWNLRQLLNHTLGVMDHVAGTVAGNDVPPGFDPAAAADTDRIGTAPAVAFEAVAERGRAAWRAPGVFERTCSMPGGALPAPVIARLALIDMTMHGWDVARSTGEDVAIPDGLATELLEISRQLVQDGLRGSAFAAEVPITDGSASDRLAAFLGRKP